jgi:dihydrodiol dehydrogenase / D-xylose 1-dehydrogenase (NADP)
MVPFRWAITSAGKIAADFAHAVRQLEGHEVVAVAARSEAAAREFCARHARGAAAYGGYEAMFRCDRHGADACYVATRPDSHRALCERLIARRVPTLCEKPLATSVDDVAALYAAAAAGRTFLMEGVWTRCFPATAKARELLRGGAIGDVVAVQAEFGYAIANGCPDGVRGSAATGGMGRDIGVYLAEKALLAFDSRDYDLADARGVAVLGRGDGVDLTVAASARMVGRDPTRRGGVASLLWTGQCDTPEVCAVLGTAGSLRFAATHHTPRALEVTTRTSRTASRTEVLDFPEPGDDGAHRWNYPGSISLQYEAASVARAVRAGAVEAPEWTHADSLAAHRIVERVRDQCYAPAADVDAAKPGDF